MTYQTCDIFTTGAEVLVNPCNLQGVMGKGLALQFKQKFPPMFAAYRIACLERRLKIGSMHVHYCGREEARAVPGVKVIINFPTKTEWRMPSKLEYIDLGLRDLVRHLRNLHPASVALPALGCGLGGLSFEDQVRPLIEFHLSDLSHPLLVLLR